MAGRKRSCHLKRDASGRFRPLTRWERDSTPTDSSDGNSSASGDDTSLETESIQVMEMCGNCRGPIEPCHQCEPSARRVRIIIDSGDSDDGVQASGGKRLRYQAAASGSGTKRQRGAASGSGTKRQQATAAIKQEQRSICRDNSEGRNKRLRSSSGSDGCSKVVR
ncbi:hypothetical protein ABZP36_003709 [Zizania latifolia]